MSYLGFMLRRLKGNALKLLRSPRVLRSNKLKGSVKYTLKFFKGSFVWTVLWGTTFDFSEVLKNFTVIPVALFGHAFLRALSFIFAWEHIIVSALYVIWRGQKSSKLVSLGSFLTALSLVSLSLLTSDYMQAQEKPGSSGRSFSLWDIFSTFQFTAVDMLLNFLLPYNKDHFLLGSYKIFFTFL